MKKGLFFTLCLSFLLAGCNAASSGNNSSNSPGANSATQSVSSADDSSISDDGGDNTDETVVSSNDEEEQQKNKIDLSKISSARPFSEGKTFVRLDGDDKYKKEYCIDKEGTILFEVETKVFNEPVGFYNGIAAFWGDYTSSLGALAYFCDEAGKITTPADLGVDEFLFDTFPKTDPALAFKDGYFFARKTEASFEGNVHKVAIFNYKFEMVTDFSTELYELYQKYFEKHSCAYYNGYVYFTSENESPSFHCLDIKTGKESHDYEEILNKLDIKHPSDFWKSDSGRDSAYDDAQYSYYDIITGEKVIDLSQYPTIDEVGEFKNGLAPIFFKVSDDVDTTNYFTLLKEDGTFAFDPIQTEIPRGYMECNGQYLIRSRINNNSFRLSTFDTNGKIAETTVTLDDLSRCNFNFSDGVISITAYYQGQTVFYNADLQPLF